MRLVLSMFLIVLALPMYVLFHGQSWEMREEVRLSTPAGYVLPSKFSRILALGHQGIVSDFLFLKGMTFVGERSLGGETMAEEDWDYLVAILETVTDLDPYFLDPYMLGQGLLTWGAGRVEDANHLLEKGLEYRTNDWRIPFYIGFNHFYFLEDYANGGRYILKAAQMPGSHSYLPNLAARLSYYGGQSKTALLFLKELLVETTDQRLSNQLQIRMTALERAVQIEECLLKFTEEEGRSPSELRELVALGYMESLPDDPYGGQWVILKNGRVFSTSKFASMKSAGQY